MYLNFVEKHKHMEVHVELHSEFGEGFQQQRFFFVFCGTEGNHEESLENKNLLRMLEQWF